MPQHAEIPCDTATVDQIPSIELPWIAFKDQRTAGPRSVVAFHGDGADHLKTVAIYGRLPFVEVARLAKAMGLRMYYTVCQVPDDAEDLVKVLSETPA
jgi:hypothetical protein